MAQKTEYQDLEVKGSLLAKKIINSDAPTNYLLRADGNLQNPTNPIKEGDVLHFSENGGFDQLWYMLQYGLLLSNNTNCVKKEDRLIEYIDNETGNVSVVNNFLPLFVGKTLRWTAFNSDREGSLAERLKSNFNSNCKPFSLLVAGNVRNSNCIYTVEYYKYTNATGDGDYTNQANFEWVSVFSKEMSFGTTFIALPRRFIMNNRSTYYIQNIRVSITPTNNDPKSNNDPSYYNYIKEIDVFYFSSPHESLLNANRLINYDAVIAPTQTGLELKTLPWWMQYITQGVNWLKKNSLPASTLDAKTISDFSDLSSSQVNYLIDSTLTESIFNQKVTFPSDWKGRKICLTLAPVTFQKDYDYSLKVMFANYMKATGARLFVENDLTAMVGVSTLIKIIIDNNIIVIEAYIEG